MLKRDLIAAAKQYRFIEDGVSRSYIDQNPDRDGTMFASVSTSCTRPVSDILTEIDQTFATTTDASDARALVAETHRLLSQGEFEESYDNISRVAPELKASFIYRAFGHIGQSIEDKNIGDALNRCFYGQEKCYHALGFVPGSNRATISCKA